MEYPMSMCSITNINYYMVWLKPQMFSEKSCLSLGVSDWVQQSLSSSQQVSPTSAPGWNMKTRTRLSMLPTVQISLIPL